MSLQNSRGRCQHFLLCCLRQSVPARINERAVLNSFSEIRESLIDLRRKSPVSSLARTVGVFGPLDLILNRVGVEDHRPSFDTGGQ